MNFFQALWTALRDPWGSDAFSAMHLRALRAEGEVARLRRALSALQKCETRSRVAPSGCPRSGCSQQMPHDHDVL
jgi:hypothetical protein